MPQRKLRWSRLSGERLMQIADYIGQDSLQNARKVIADIRKAARKIPANPEANPIAKQLPSPDNLYRFILVHRYKIIYKILPEYILILDIFHSSRAPKGIEELEE